MLSFVILIVGFVLLVFGADKFVEGASALAKKLGVPPIIVGLTIVAFGTSAPELAVSISAGMQDANEIVLGNVMGSNIFNLLMVVGFSCIFAPLVIEKSLLKRDWPYLILISLVVVVLMYFGNDISALDGIILLCFFAFLLFLQIKSALKSSKLKPDEEEIIVKMSGLKITLYIIFGLAAIIIGGQLSVNGATDIAKMFGISETIIGLTIVAIGTSLPELVTSVVATKRGENDIAIGNVIGSNIFNILLILGISSIFSPIAIQMTGIYDALIVLIITVVMFLIAKFAKFKLPIGISMILCYVAYTFWIIVR
ncbi:MAG: calcium/sodium antiporter [Clostridia bacterium]